MIFTPARIAGFRIIDIERREDERGFFARTFCEAEMAAHQIDFRVIQSNVSWCRARGTLRGLHYLAAPHGEPKIVRCTRGALWDVALDLRRDSPTFRQWMGVELTAENRRMVYLPPGLAHGFLTLTDDTEVFYEMGAPYVESAARTVRWNDPAFGIEWPFQAVVMSRNDCECPLWNG